MKKIFLFTICLIISVSTSYSQLIDVFQIHAGANIFPTNEMLQLETGKPENLYGGFDPGQTVGVGISKFILDRVQLIGTFDLMRTEKYQYRERTESYELSYGMNSSKFGLGLKYNVLVPDIYKFSPYLIANANLMMVNFRQESFKRYYEPPVEEYSGLKNVIVTEIIYQEPAYNFVAPVYGWSVGGGFDYNFYGSYSLFAEYAYTNMLATKSGLQNEYSSFNKSELIFHNVIAGLRIYLY